VKGKKAYRATDVKRVDLAAMVRGREGQAVEVGVDVAKREVLAVSRWREGSFLRPWSVENPGELMDFVGLLQRMRAGRELTVAMEPTGTYGDALRQALSEAGISVVRVSPKAAHDYAEVFDGVPSQHDGKDAAVVAELAAMGKARPWPYEPLSEWEQQLLYWVDWLDAQQRQQTMWGGRLEGLMARYWPEATQWLKLSSGTMLQVLAWYGGPAALAADTGACARLCAWGGPYLAATKVRGLMASAASTVGVRQGAVEVSMVRAFGEQALAAHREANKSVRQLRKLAEGHEVLQRQGVAVGVPTACVLWVHLGDPRAYHCAEAYRKAMGLNLAERSSGEYEGRLRISKRGSAEVRRWLYFAALRLVMSSAVRPWYLRKKAADGEEAKRALVGVMRRLAIGLYRVAVDGVAFDAARLFPGGRIAAAGA
jgi:transposase